MKVKDITNNIVQKAIFEFQLDKHQDKYEVSRAFFELKSFFQQEKQLIQVLFDITMPFELRSGLLSQIFSNSNDSGDSVKKNSSTMKRNFYFGMISWLMESKASYSQVEEIVEKLGLYAIVANLETETSYFVGDYSDNKAKSLSLVLQELLDVRNFFRNHPDLAQLASSDSLHSSIGSNSNVVDKTVRLRLGLVEELFLGKLSLESLEILKIIISKSYKFYIVGEITQILFEIASLSNISLNIVTTSNKVTLDQAKNIVRYLEGLTEQKVILVDQNDEALLVGFIIASADMQISSNAAFDLSVIRRELVESKSE